MVKRYIFLMSSLSFSHNNKSSHYHTVNHFILQVNQDTDNVRVIVRCRPMNDKEKGSGHKMAVKVDEVRGSITISNPTSKGAEPPKVFTFDRVFAPECKQTDVYNDGARPIVESVIEGYNGMQSNQLLRIIHKIIHMFISLAFKVPSRNFQQKMHLTKQWPHMYVCIISPK